MGRVVTFFQSVRNREHRLRSPVIGRIIVNDWFRYLKPEQSEFNARMRLFSFK